MKKQLRFLITLLVLIMFAVSGCGSQQPAKAPEQAPAQVAVDKAAVTKLAAWDGFKKMTGEVSGKLFPLDAVKAKELYVGNEAKYLLVDMRTPEDYAKGHAKGAVNIPLGKFPEMLEKLPADKTIMLYCYTGQQSSLTTVPLKAYGYKAISISKGFPMIEKAGFAMDTAAVAFTPVENKKPADAKEAAARAGVKEAFEALVKQAVAKTLIVKGEAVKGLVDAAPDKHFVVDLRAAADHDKGFVKGATNIPLATLSDKLGTLPKDKTIVLYCYSGQTAAMAAVPLKAEGYKVISIYEGFPGAQAAKLEIAKK